MLVKDLIEILNKVDPNLEIVMSMNQEYSCTVDADMVAVTEYPRLGVGPRLEINDALAYPRVDDTVDIEEVE